ENPHAARVAGGRQAMSFSISTLLTRNLDDVFGEIDPARRRAAIDEIFAEDCVFYEPMGVHRGCQRCGTARPGGACRSRHPPGEARQLRGAWISRNCWRRVGLVTTRGASCS